MSNENPDDLEERLRTSSEDSTLSNKGKSIDNLVDPKKSGVIKFLTDKQTWKAVFNYLTNKQRLKAIAVLGGTIGGVAVLKDRLPEVTEYIRDNLPFLSKERVSLIVDTLTNTLLAPLGYLLSNYAHGKKLSKKEFLGHVAFAGAWGVARHYVYSGLSNFDKITPPNVSLKISLYTLYYAVYGGLYSAFTEYWSQVCRGVSKLRLSEVGKNFKERLDDLAKDPGIQLNLALNILNMFNPWKESRPTAAGALLIPYNMDIIKHADKERRIGFLNYLKAIFIGDSSRRAEVVTGPDLLESEKVYVEKLPRPTIIQKIAGASELAGAYLTMGYGAALPVGTLSLSAYSFYNGDIVAGIVCGASSVILYFPARYLVRLGQYFGKIGKARFNGLQGEALERIKYEGLKIFHPKDPRNYVIDNFVQRRFDPNTMTKGS